MSKTLHLVLKAKWYDMIERGEKREEYREIKPYWEKRLLDYASLKKYVRENIAELRLKQFLFPKSTPIEDACRSFPRGYTHVCFSYGYTKRTMTYEVDGIQFGTGKPEWGAEKDKPYFVIKIGRRIL